MGLVTLTFDLLTLTGIRASRNIPNLGTLGLRVLELFAMHATDGQTQAMLNAPSLGRGTASPVSW